MISMNILLLFSFILMKEISGENTRSIQMYLHSNLIFQCTQTTCLSFLNLTTSNQFRCEIACLELVKCKVIIYYRPTMSCQLFDDTLNQTGSMSYYMDAVTIIVIAGTRFPSESTTTTTTTPSICNSTYIYQTWPSTNDSLAQWSFDGDYHDQMNNYNATPSNSMSFVTNGYIRQALVITDRRSFLNVSYIPILYKSFTVDVWLFITAIPTDNQGGLFAICSSLETSKCLHLSVRRSNGAVFLYFGFYYNDCQGTTVLKLNTWIHAAFVFHYSNVTRQTYLNGILDKTCSNTSNLIATPTPVLIGDIPILAGPNLQAFQGYIDQMTVSNRAKSASEILDIATLVAYFTFNTDLFLIDSGPNSLNTITQSTSPIANGHSSQGITFDGTNASYFQIAGFTALGISNKSFSISVWIRPVSLSGVIVHVSSMANGTGWCLPFLGFDNNRSLVAQIYNSTSLIVSVSNQTLSVSTSLWSHIVQTWSATNGLRLYMNNVLVASELTSATQYAASSSVNYITLGNSLNGQTGCSNPTVINPSSYNGDMDDFRVYSRELSTTDIIKLYCN